jgi:hypothetical protein
MVETPSRLDFGLNLFLSLCKFQLNLLSGHCQYTFFLATVSQFSSHHPVTIEFSTKKPPLGSPLPTWLSPDV